MCLSIYIQGGAEVYQHIHVYIYNARRMKKIFIAFVKAALVVDIGAV